MSITIQVFIFGKVDIEGIYRQVSYGDNNASSHKSFSSNENQGS